MTTVTRLIATALAVALPQFATAAVHVIDFEDIALAPGSHYYDPENSSFISGGATFNHHAYEYFWNGWTISNRDDRVTAGYLNQFSAYADSADGRNQYALSYAPLEGWGETPSISFLTPSLVHGALFTNTTYAVLSMLNGDGFAKKFGGSDGDDPDYFVLNVTGRDAAGAVTGSVEIYLADFRFADGAQDYILTDWTHFNLSSLGVVSRLEFSLNSSDTGNWGMNTPAYFALDGLSVSPVPWPAAPLMFSAGLALLGVASRRRDGSAPAPGGA